MCLTVRALAVTELTRDGFLPASECIRERWDPKKTMKQNLMDLGLSFDPNRSLPVRQSEDEVGRINAVVKK